MEQKQLTPISAHDFRHALGSFATGVSIASTIDQNGEAYGLTVNSFSSVSLDPPLIQFCLGKTSHCYDIFMSSKQFVISILAADQEDLSRHFAVAGQQERWNNIPTTPAPMTGIPTPPDCLCVIECNVYKLVQAGDHVIVIGQVVATSLSDKTEPLLYFRGSYNNFLRN